MKLSVAFQQRSSTSFLTDVTTRPTNQITDMNSIARSTYRTGKKWYSQLKNALIEQQVIFLDLTNAAHVPKPLHIISNQPVRVCKHPVMEIFASQPASLQPRFPPAPSHCNMPQSFWIFAKSRFVTYMYFSSLHVYIHHTNCVVIHVTLTNTFSI